jgi:hypothetical protein
MAITAQDKLECVERELGYRRRVYPRRVGAGQMTERLALRQIELMEAIAEDYRRQAEQERLL